MRRNVELEVKRKRKAGKKRYEESKMRKYKTKVVWKIGEIISGYEKSELEGESKKRPNVRSSHYYERKWSQSGMENRLQKLEGESEAKNREKEE